MKSRLILMMAGIALNYSPVLHAQTTGAYLGMGLARSKTNIDAMTIDTLPYSYVFTGKPIFFTASQDNATTNSGWSLYGGYRFNRYFAVEALYQPLGEYSRTGSNRGLVDPSLTQAAGFGTRVSLTISDTDRLHLQGYGLTAVGSYPFANYMYLFGKAGLFYWNGKLDRSTTITNNGIDIKTLITSETATGISPIYGIGLRIDLTRSLSVRGEWSHISGVGGGLSTGKSDANVTSFSAEINF